MRIIDSHMHLFDVTGRDWYPALQQMAQAYSLPNLYRNFLLEDYTQAAGPTQVEGFVHVSATTKPRAYLDEAAWIERIAEDNNLSMVLIGTIDPTAASEQIEADLEQQAKSSRFRGVRVLYDFASDSDAAAVVLDWLEERDYVLDLVTQPAHIAEWLKKLEQHPHLRVALEHTGWPEGTQEAQHRAWRTAIRDFATSTNAPCKLSGLGMVTGDLSAPALEPWLEYAIEQFGWERVMFGSNMPIETMAGTYRDLLTTLETITDAASEEEQRGFWADNAAQFYRL